MAARKPFLTWTGKNYLYFLPGQIDRTQILGPTVLTLLGQTPSGQCEASSQFLQVMVKAQRSSVISFTDTTSLPARV